MATKTTKTPKTSTVKPEANGKHDPKTSEIRWTDKKIALLKALKKLNATSATSAVRVEKAVKAGGGADKCLSNVNPAFDMTVQGYIGWSDTGEGKGIYVTPKGLKALAAASK